MTERILSVSTIVFAAFFLVLSLQIEARADNLIGPGTWPGALMAMMLVLGIILTISLFRKKKAETASAATATEITADDEDLMAEYEDEIVYPNKFYYMIGLLILYTIGLTIIGFILSTVLLILAGALLFGMKKWITALITAVVSTAGFILLFPILLSLPFPRGIGIFRDFSLLFY